MSTIALSKCGKEANELLTHLLNVGISPVRDTRTGRPLPARDPRTGEPLAQSLHEYLFAVHQELTKAQKPVPEDLLMVCVRLSLEAVRNIVGHPRYRLLRKRKLLPPHKADEVDSSSLMWLARQPGRNNREKLATRNRMMAVDREVSLNTAENRLLVRFVRYIEPLLSARLQERDTYDKSTESTARLAMIGELHELCSDILSGRELEDIEPSIVIQPNNAMLSDPNYNLIWRAFNLLRMESQLEPLAEQAITRTLFIGLMALLVKRYSTQCCEQLIRADAGIGDEPTGLTIGTRRASGAGDFVTLLIPSTINRFGFLRDRDGTEKIWFSPASLAAGVDWLSVKKGSRVNYRRSLRDSMPAVSGITLTNKDYSGVVMSIFETTNTRALQLRYEGSRIHLDISSWKQNGKGQNIDSLAKISVNSKGRFSVSLSARGNDSRTCDLSFPGLMAAAEFVCARGVDLTAADQQNEEPIDNRTVIAGVGIDVSGAAVECHVDGKYELSCPELFGARYPALSPALQACFKGYVYDPRADTAEYVFLSSLWRPSSTIEMRDAAELAHCFCEQLKAHLTLTAESRLAVAVPDDADDFSLRPLLDNLEVSYPERVGVIRRSVAAALAWQQSTGYAGADICPGDVLLVVDAGGPSLCTTPLVARGDSRLEGDPSRGILWERRPSYIPEDWDESMAYRSLLLEYAISAVRFHGCEVSSTDKMASTLVDMGVIHIVLRERSSRFIPLSARHGAGVLEVQYVPVTWQRICEKWVVSMTAHFACWESRNGPLADLLGGVLGLENRVTLLLSLPDAMRDAIANEWKAKVSRSLPQEILVGPACYMDKADAQLAVGAQIAARRLANNIPVCIEWMPELSLEVVKNGHFGLLPIFTENTVTASLGQSITCAVEDELILGAGNAFYEFPLLQGRTGQKPLQYLARLEPQRRLEKDLQVRLTVRFSYGTNRYTLTAKPTVASDITAQHLAFTWAREHQRATIIAPPSPQPLGLDPEETARLIDWLTKSSEILCSVCKDAFESSRFSADRADWFADWLEKAFEVPLRRLWLSGQRLNVAPDFAREQWNQSFKWLLRLTGLTEDEHGMVWPETLLNHQPVLRDKAILILTRARRDCPKPLVKWLASVCHDKALIGPDVWQDGISRILALDAEDNEHLRSVVFDVFRSSSSGRAFDPKYVATIRATIASALWSDDQATEIINKNFSADLRYLFMTTEQELQVLAYRVRNMPPNDGRLRSLSSSFSHHCVVLLGLLRLTPTDRKWNDVLSIRSQKLVRCIRSADSAFAEKRIPVKSRLRFDLQKPASLFRMSDIAFATTAFLSGDTKCTLAIVSMDEEEEE